MANGAPGTEPEQTFARAAQERLHENRPRPEVAGGGAELVCVRTHPGVAAPQLAILLVKCQSGSQDYRERTNVRQVATLTVDVGGWNPQPRGAGQFDLALFVECESGLLSRRSQHANVSAARYVVA